MFIPIPPSSLERKSIRLDYLNPHKNFMGGFMDNPPSACNCEFGNKFQESLSAVWDFSQNYDSVNFLTETRSKFSVNTPDSKLAKFSESPPELETSDITPLFNYWVTTPLEIVGGDTYCHGESNLIPLKNNFDENERVTCKNPYREYSGFNFGEHGLDNFRPNLIYHSDTILVESDEAEFVFRIPDNSLPLNLSSMDFSCFNAIAGDCPPNSDNIIWGDNMITWLSGSECEGVWVDREYGLNGETCLSSFPSLESVLYKDTNPSNLFLVSGQDYIYQKPSRDNKSLGSSIVNVDNSIVGRFAFIADAGLATPDQQQTAFRLDGLGGLSGSPELDGVFFGGDNNYETGDYDTIEANWAVFDKWVVSETAFPALGNHDIDAFDLGEPQTDKFSYLPNNRRYYSKFFETPSLELFVLNVGKDSGGTFREPDGYTIGSVQYNWFIDALSKSKAKYRVVMFHHPYASAIENEGRVVPEMDWGFDELGIDLVLNGHTHTNQHLKHNGMDILDISAVARTTRQISCDGSIKGSNDGVTKIWSDSENCQSDGVPSYAVIDVSPCGIIISINRVSDGVSVHSFSIKNNRLDGTEAVNEFVTSNNEIFRGEALEGNVFVDGSGNMNNANFIK